MKKSLFLLPALMIYFTLLFVQQAAAQGNWSLAGNSNATASSKLGTTNSVPLVLYTNNVERMRIDASGRVGIGTNAPISKLHVIGGGYFSGLLVGAGNVSPANFVNAGVSGCSSYTGVYGRGDVYGILGTGNNVGVYAQGIAVGNVAAYGVHAEGTIGVRAEGTATGLIGNGSNLGVHGSSDNTGVRGDGDILGVFATGGVTAFSGNGGTYGGYFFSQNGTGIRAATGRSDKKWAGRFDGSVLTSGNFQASDRSLKKNIQDVDDAISLITRLKPKNFEFQGEEKFKAFGLPHGRHYGFIAQELEEVLPNLVEEFDLTPPAVIDPAKGLQEREAAVIMNAKAVNYTELIPLLVKAIQEQQTQITNQQAQIGELKQLVNRLLQGETINTSLTNSKLEQNSPNPVSRSTRIEYSLPKGVVSAQLVIADNLGRTLRQIQVSNSGVINLDTSNLSNGVYTYSLVVDGKTVHTRKMTVER